MRRITLLLLFLLFGGIDISANAQTARLQAREAEWKNYQLPQTNFARHVAANNKLVFRVPADWKQDDPQVLTFAGPHSSWIRVLVQDIPDGYPLTEFFAAILQNVRNTPGATESTLTRRTQFQDLEARELLIESPDPAGEMTRSTSWVTTVGPLAVTFNLWVPLEHAATIEPFFKATVQSVIFLPKDNSAFETLRAGAVKTAGVAPIHEIETIVASLNELNSDRESAINRLTAMFSASPDAVLDLLLDRREIVRSAAVEALVRSKNGALKLFLWHAVQDPDALIAEPAARSIARDPDTAGTPPSTSSAQDGIEISARLWPFLTNENRAKLLIHILGPAGRSLDPNLKLGALTLLSMSSPSDLGLPFPTVLAANSDSLTIVALQTANYRGESLPVDSLFKLASSANARIKQLAIENLGQSAAVTDIPRIESLKGLAEERKLAIKKIRLRSDIHLAKGAEEIQEIIRKAMSDSSLAEFAWRFHCEPTASGCSSASPKPLPHEFKIARFAENVLPKKLRHYAAIPNPGQTVQRFYQTLHGLQLDSPRAQSNLILVMGTLRETLGRELGAPADATTLIDYTGIQPDAPIVIASWTAPGGSDAMSLSQRRAIVLTVKDRARFERVVEHLQQSSSSSIVPMTDYAAVVTRAVAALPALLPFSAKEMLAGKVSKPRPKPALKYSFIGQTEWNGIPIKTIEERFVDSEWTVNATYTCLAFVGDTAILASDVATIRELLMNATAGSEQLLAGNEEFRRSVATDGDVVYFSDLNSVFPDQYPKKKAEKANESGALKFSSSTWENSHRLVFDESDWSKPLVPFHPRELAAPGELLPASTLAYYVMKLDVAAAFERWLNDLSFLDEFKSAADLWAMDFKREVLPELGPECGAALLDLPEFNMYGSGGTWAVFCKLKTNKLTEALTSGKLFRNVGPTADVAELKHGANSFFVASKRGFLVVSNERKGLTLLANKTNLASTRDYSRAAERAPSGIVAFGGYNLEAAIAGASAAGEGLQAKQAAIIFSVASAFHSQSFYATATASGIEGRSSVAMDREGRYAVSDFSYLPRGANITLATVEPRGVPITDQNRISTLVLKIRARTAGPIDGIRDDIKSAHQTVEQKSANELILSVASRRTSGDKKVQLPVTNPDLAQYLKASGDIAADDKDVIARAKEIAGDDRDAWSVARKLSQWTHDNLEWKHVTSAGAAQTLASREADCSEFSELFVAMARSLGLPARTVSGLAHSGSSFGGHAWVEVWAGEWIELDPTWGTDFVDATHIRDTSSALVTSAALNLIDVEVLEARHSIADFQKTPKALVDHLLKVIPAGDRSEIEAAIDLETLTDEHMGAGSWKSLNEDERDQMSSAYRRVMHEIIEGYGERESWADGIRLLHLEEKGERAEAVCLDAADDTLFKLRFVLRDGAWRVVELVQADTGLRIAAEMMAPAVKSIEAARAGKKTTAAGLSDFTRALMLFNTDPQKAAEIIERAVQANPTDQGLRYTRALTLLMLDREDEGVKLLTELSKEQPVHPASLFKLAEYVSDTKAEEAIELFKYYSSFEPFDTRAYHNLGMLYEEKEQVALAEAAYRKQIAIDAADLSAYVDVMRILMLNNRVGEVNALLIAADPHTGPDHDLLATLLNDLYDDVKLADAQKLADSEPQRMKTSLHANLALANLYLRDDQPRASLPSINRAIQIDPKIPEPQISLSTAYLMLSRFADAMKAANHAVSLDQESADAHYQRARVLARLGRIKEAFAALEKAIELDPEVVDWVETDPHMKPLKSLPAFKKLIQDHKSQTTPN